MGTSTQNPLGWGLVDVDEAALDETAVRAAQSMDRMKSLRVSLFSMVFSFVVSSPEPLRLRCRRCTGTRERYARARRMSISLVCPKSPLPAQKMLKDLTLWGTPRDDAKTLVSVCLYWPHESLLRGAESE
jgi:hypothetical protein